MVSGSGQILTEGSETAAYAAFTVENGTISGSRVQMDWRTPSSTFSWDLRLASSIMVGSYQQTDAAGRFIGRGTAEFRYRAVSRLVDTWVAAYVDTHAPRPPLVSQFALVTVSTQDTRGALGGTGSVRFANNDVAEQRRRLFNMAGTVSGDQIQWEWRGADLFGQTVWHLRQAGNLLFGTYTNFTNAGAVAATGEAVWVRATRTPALTP
ncbi:MAG: hypothetical protein HY706_11395 [Candidatus Hydrogenedentes bacterium]|nr:hypothetical protein [Candidatus Hydrogenedentota bacterium]